MAQRQRGGAARGSQRRAAGKVVGRVMKGRCHGVTAAD